MHSNILIATDASGGQHTSDPRLRRIGWGAVVVDLSSFEGLVACFGNLPGPIQTVPRGELHAVRKITQALQLSSSVGVVIDCKYVVQGLHKGPMASHGKNQDIWQ